MFTKTKIANYYFNPKEKLSLYKFSNSLQDLIISKNSMNYPIVLICIGTDRATGDSLGPIIGYKLEKYYRGNIKILGTLANPVHAKNLESSLDQLKELYRNAFVVAIDASLGRADHIGLVNLGEGPIAPGAGVNKVLPPVGDIYITGIVNFSGPMELLMLQNTRLNTVMEMADFITLGIATTLSQLKEKKCIV